MNTTLKAGGEQDACQVAARVAEETAARWSSRSLFPRQVIADAVTPTVVAFSTRIRLHGVPDDVSAYIRRSLWNTCRRIGANQSKEVKKQRGLLRERPEQYINIHIDTTFAGLTLEKLRLLLRDRSASENVLTDHEFDVFTLFYGRGFTVGTIAELLERRNGTVKTELSRVREKLRRWMEREVA